MRCAGPRSTHAQPRRIVASSAICHGARLSLLGLAVVSLLDNSATFANLKVEIACRGLGGKRAGLGGSGWQLSVKTN
jgi:hypothetical protein